METIIDYSRYLTRIESGDSLCISCAESSALRLLNAIDTQIDDGPFYVLDLFDGDGLFILVQVYKQQSCTRITKYDILPFSINQIAAKLDVSNVDKAIRWWNLCYSKHNNQISYDKYYDDYYVADDSSHQMRELEIIIKSLFERIPFEVNLPIYVLGQVATYNPILYLLQKNMLANMVLIPDCVHINSYSDEELINIRNKFSGIIEIARLSLYTIVNNGSLNISPDLGRPYLVSLPCDHISLNDIAIGDLTYNTILPDNQILYDYQSGSYRFMYLEVTYFVDLFGNILMKATNSKYVSKIVILSKSEFLN